MKVILEPVSGTAKAEHRATAHAVLVRRLTDFSGQMSSLDKGSQRWIFDSPRKRKR